MTTVSKLKKVFLNEYYDAQEVQDAIKESTEQKELREMLKTENLLVESGGLGVGF